MVSQENDESENLHQTAHGDENTHGQRLAGQARQRRVVEAGFGRPGIILATLLCIGIVVIKLDGAKS